MKKTEIELHNLYKKKAEINKEIRSLQSLLRIEKRPKKILPHKITNKAKEVIKEVSKDLWLEYSQVMSWYRHKRYIEAKTIISKRLRNLWYTYQSIWNIFDCNHASIIYLVQK